MGGLYRGFELG